MTKEEAKTILERDKHEVVPYSKIIAAIKTVSSIKKPE
jgi:hypothetical protein